MTGKKTDKAALPDVFHGELETAPMIRQCMVNMEMKPYDVLNLEEHEIFVGELVRTYADGRVMTDGKIDLAKLWPLLFDMANKKCWSSGLCVGNCWDVGKSLKLGDQAF